jgi:hypothetical protein
MTNLGSPTVVEFVDMTIEGARNGEGMTKTE